MDNKQVLMEFDKVVFGHQEAKKILINLVRRSQARYDQKWWRKTPDIDLPVLSNCLLIGQSGTGKTHLIESLSKILDFPFFVVDATQLTHTSASGGTELSHLIKQIKNHASDLWTRSYNAQDGRYLSFDGVLDQMIVFVDEIDKLGNKASNSWNQGTQATFLRFFENKTELTGLSFVFAGAFSDADTIHKTKKKKPIGFTHQKLDEMESEEELNKAILAYGIMPELLGRMGVVVKLDHLTVEQYETILQTIVIPKKIRDLQKARIYVENIDDVFQQKMKGAALKAFNSGLGVRHLVTTINKAAVDIEFFNTEVLELGIKKYNTGDLEIFDPTVLPNDNHDC